MAACCRENVGCHQSRVHAHAVIRRIQVRPVSDAATVLAAVEANHLIAPQIALRRALRRDNANVGGRVIGPQNAVAPAYGAIAVGHYFRGGKDL